MAIVSLRIGYAIIVSRRTKGYRCALIFTWSLWLTSFGLAIRTVVPDRPGVALHLHARPGTTTRSRSVPGREAPDPAPVDPVLPVPDPAALRGPLAALRDRVARTAAQQEQGAGVRLIGLQAFVSDEVSQIFHQRRALPHRVNARLGIERCAIA